LPGLAPREPDRPGPPAGDANGQVAAFLADEWLIAKPMIALCRSARQTDALRLRCGRFHVFGQ